MNRPSASRALLWTAIVVSLASTAVDGQGGRTFDGQTSTTPKAWTPPRTPHGDPDLQGVWISRSATPLERPKALEGRDRLTNLEVVELRKRADRIFKTGNSDFGAGDAVFLAALASGAGPAEAVRRANAAAALSVTRGGPATGPTAAELAEFLASRP